MKESMDERGGLVFPPRRKGCGRYTKSEKRVEELASSRILRKSGRDPC